MKHRWDKGKKGEDANRLPNGEKIVHLKVGGRTSAIVPSVQKKTAAVAGDVDPADLEDGYEKPVNAGEGKSKSDAEEGDDGEKVEEKPVVKKGRGGKKVKAESMENDEFVAPAATKSARTKRQTTSVKSQEHDEEESQANGGAEEDDEPKSAKKRKATPKKAEAPPTPGSRRSTRTKK